MTAETNTSVVERCQSAAEKAPAVRELTGRLGSQHVPCKSVYAGICRSTRRGDLIWGSPGIHVELALWCGLAKGEGHEGTTWNRSGRLNGYRLLVVQCFRRQTYLHADNFQ